MKVIKNSGYNMNSIKAEEVESGIVELALNINLDIVKPGTIMKIDLEKEDKVIVGQVYTASPKELTLFFIDSDSRPEVREFTIDEFTSGRWVPYIVNF